MNGPEMRLKKLALTDMPSLLPHQRNSNNAFDQYSSLLAQSKQSQKRRATTTNTTNTLTPSTCVADTSKSRSAANAVIVATGPFSRRDAGAARSRAPRCVSTGTSTCARALGAFVVVEVVDEYDGEGHRQGSSRKQDVLGLSKDGQMTLRRCDSLRGSAQRSI